MTFCILPVHVTSTKQSPSVNKPDTSSLKYIVSKPLPKHRICKEKKHSESLLHVLVHLFILPDIKCKKYKYLTHIHYIF